MQTIRMKGDENMLLRRFLTGFLALVLAMTVAGCEPEPDPDGGKKIIAVSIPPQKAFAAAICGDEMQIITVIPPGNSPANYEPDAREMQYLSKADLYFSIGVAAESAFILPRLCSIQVVDLAARVARELPDRHFASGSRDPHIWLSVARARVMVEAMLEAITKLDPGRADVYAVNAQAFLDELDRLEQDMRALLAGHTDRPIVVYHPSYGYLADELDLEMWALEENGKEATPQHLQAIIDRARQAEIRVIFCQAEIDSRQSAAFAEEIGANIQILDPLSEDYIANMRAIARAFADAS